MIAAGWCWLVRKLCSVYPFWRHHHPFNTILNDADLNAPHPGLSTGDQEQAERHDAERVSGVDGAWRAYGLRISGLSRRHVGEDRKRTDAVTPR